jgi:hypothetical protein
MPRDIQPLTEADLAELRQFLIAGFRAEPEADFAALDVLRWKYLEPLESATTTKAQPENSPQQNPGVGADAIPNAPFSYIARNAGGPIIGHLGLCRTAFEGRMITTHGGEVSTIHIIDWLGSPEHRSVGMSLMRRAHQGVATQFGLGVSQAALVVGERAGYQFRRLVPVYNRVLHPGYWLRTSGLNSMERGLKLVRDAVSQLVQPRANLREAISLERCPAFGPEITPIVVKAKAHAILTRRDPRRMNAFLRFPRQAFSGWYLVDQKGQLRGFAVLNLIPKDHGRTCVGKIVDCLLDDVELDLWHAAVWALTREIAHQGADLAQAYASTPWTASALRRAGYTSRFAVKFHIRDRLALMPHDEMFHLTPLEGDYAYT